MNENFQELESQAADRDTALSFSSSMFRVGEFFERVKEAFQPIGHDTLFNRLANRGGIPLDKVNWFTQGVDCEILKTNGKGWQKGKIRIKISLEFCPNQTDELPESSDAVDGNSDSTLDDIRQMIGE
jgi:hypothetical protein